MFYKEKMLSWDPIIWKFNASVINRVRTVLKLLKKIEPDFISTYITNPLPGTYLYDHAKSKAIMVEAT